MAGNRRRSRRRATTGVNGAVRKSIAESEFGRITPRIEGGRCALCKVQGVRGEPPGVRVGGGIFRSSQLAGRVKRVAKPNQEGMLCVGRICRSTTES